MKFNNEKERQSDLPMLIISVILATVIFASGVGDRITVAVASAMLYAGELTEQFKEISNSATEKHSDQNETATQKKKEKSTEEKAETVKTKSDKMQSDITETPEDIVALIKKYTELFKNDEKDGTIKPITYDKAGATHIFENVKVKNTTDTKTLNIEKVLSQPLELSIDKSKPAVLIFHSHTSEGYEMIERDWYAQNYIARSNDESRNIVRVGTEIANYLTKLGYTVIHDKTIHDKSYSDSYSNSRKTIEKHLSEHPEIQIVLDIHRDSITQNNGDKIKPVNTIGGKKAAQLMIITGAQEGKVENFPDWEYNLRFALQIQKKCETMFSGLMRPVLFSQRKYNMDITRFSLLIEMGSEANTLEEACYSGRMLAAALASLMDDYIKKGD